jgi:hypothetical protein
MRAAMNTSKVPLKERLERISDLIWIEIARHSTFGESNLEAKNFRPIPVFWECFS